MAGTRRQWNKEEDDIMIGLVKRHGIKNWSVISESLSDQTGIPRTGKQCRTRYLNHLDPDINRAPWTDEENTILYEAQAKHGNKWAKISQLLPGRTDNQVKNHFYSTMRRTVRKIHREVERTKVVESKTGTAPSQIDDVIDQLSEADAASFKRCYEVLQQSITGQASPTSILNSSLPKCVTSAITNPPARSKRKKTASGGVQDVGSAPAPAPAAAATAGTAAQPFQVPPHQAGIMPGYSYASSFPPGMYAYPGMVPVSGGMPGHFLHAMQPPTAVMGQDGNLYMAYPRAAFQQAAHVQPVQPKAIPAPHPRMPSQGHSSSSRSSSNASVKLPVSVAAHPAQSTAPPTASAPPQAPPTAESEKKTIGGAKRRRSLPGGLTIATDAELDPRKLANLLPQHTPGGSLIPARRRAHTQLLLGMLSKTAQPTEQSRDAATQQAVRITVHAVPEQAAGADAEDGEDGEEAADDEVPDTDTAEAGAAAPAHATSASTTHPDSHFPPSASLLTYSSLDKAYGRMLSFQRTPGGGIVDVAPQAKSVPTTDSAAAPTTSQGGIFTFKADETGGQGGSTVGGSGHAAARPSRAAAHASRLSALLSPTSSGLPVATPRLLTSTSAASGLFFGTTPRDGAGQDGVGAAPMLFDFS